MKFEHYPLHDSIRGYFGRALYFEMQENPNIICLTADLGFGLLDNIQRDLPNQFINVGASEQSLLGAGVGLAIGQKIPIVYSITTFLLYRSFEWIRNYLNHEKIPVLMVGSGYGSDYKHDGITHQPYEVKKVLKLFPNIKTYFPKEKEEVPKILRQMIEEKQPAFLNLRR